MAERFNPNYRRDRLAEKVLCSLLANPALVDGAMEKTIGASLAWADKFLEATKPEQEESAVSEVDEFVVDSLVIDAE